MAQDKIFAVTYHNPATGARVVRLTKAPNDDEAWDRARGALTLAALPEMWPSGRVESVVEAVFTATPDSPLAPDSPAAALAALALLRNRLLQMNRDIFDHPYFIDRYRDGDKNREFIEHANAVLALYPKEVPNGR